MNGRLLCVGCQSHDCFLSHAVKLLFHNLFCFGHSWGWSMIKANIMCCVSVDCMVYKLPWVHITVFPTVARIVLMVDKEQTESNCIHAESGLTITTSTWTLETSCPSFSWGHSINSFNSNWYSVALVQKLWKCIRFHCGKFEHTQQQQEWYLVVVQPQAGKSYEATGRCGSAPVAYKGW